MRVHEIGANPVLELDEVPDATVRRGRLLIRVHGCALSFPDVLMAKGSYQHIPPLPFAPGAELSGVVLAVGDEVTGWSPGDRVVANTGYGCLSEQVCVPARICMRVPDGVDLIEASAFLSAYATSHWALHAKGRLAAGETVLVLGAAGGVGLAAVELAAVHGARVIAAASTDEKLELCRRYGAADTINYATESLRDRVKELTGGRGVDVVYDPVGGDFTEQAVRSTRWNGRVLIVGFAASDVVPRVPMNLPLLKGCEIVGCWWGGAPANDPERFEATKADLLRLWSQGLVHPHVSQILPLAQANDGMAALAERRVTGRVVVAVQR